MLNNDTNALIGSISNKMSKLGEKDYCLFSEDNRKYMSSFFQKFFNTVDQLNTLHGKSFEAKKLMRELETMDVKLGDIQNDIHQMEINEEEYEEEEEENNGQEEK